MSKYFRQENSEVLENVLFLPLATTDVNKELDKKIQILFGKTIIFNKIIILFFDSTQQKLMGGL